MTSVASHQRPNLSLDMDLAQTSGKNPRQSSRAQVQVARSAQAPRSHHGQQQQQQQHHHQHYGSAEGFHPSREEADGVVGQYDDPAGSSEDEEEREMTQAQYVIRQEQEQQRQQQQQYEQARGDTYHNGYQDSVDDRVHADESDSMSRQQGGSQMEHDDDEDEEDFGDEDEDVEEDEEEDDVDDDISSSPSIPDVNIDFDLVYALHNFVATVEGQATVEKGGSLTLLDDNNHYWWLVRVLRTHEVGYIPAENIETPFERLARLNKHRNVDLTIATDDDVIQVPSRIYSSHLVKQREAPEQVGVSEHSGKLSALSRRWDGAPMTSQSPQPVEKPSVVFGPPSYAFYVEHSGDEDGSDEEADYEDEDGEYEDDEEDGESGEIDEDEMRAQMEQEQSYGAADTPDVAAGSRGINKAQNETAQLSALQSESKGNAIPSTAAGKKLMLDKMEPDDGMDWDAHEADTKRSEKSRRINQQQQRSEDTSQNDAPASAVQQQSRRLSQDQTYSAHERDQQRMPSGEYSSSDMPRTVSNRSISSTTSSADGPMLPSHVQGGRDRAVSGASEMSQASSTTSSVVSAKDKERKRKSKGGSVDAGDEGLFNDDKSTKKRSGVFSGLFSRNKDKKDRKSGSFSSAGGSTLGPSEENIVVTRPSEETARPRDASGGPAPPGPTGHARAMQERDRASQDAYSRQFLGDRSGSINDSLSPRQSKQRPGSLIGTPSSVPMLNVVRVFAGEGVQSASTFKTVLLNESTSASDLVKQAMQRFRLPEAAPAEDYFLTVKLLEGNERPLGAEEKPLQVFDRLCQMAPQEATFMPSIKRSSIGSISSISSNLSLNPAIARVNGDFSDDHSVKFFLTRATPNRNIGNQYGRLAMSDTTGESEDFYKGISTRGEQQRGVAPSLTLPSIGVSRVIDTASADSNLLQAPTAKFALRLLIFPSELPEGIVFDPQTTAIVPVSVLAERGAGGSVPSEYIEQRFREKIVSLSSTATVAEVIETGLDRFGISDGVVEGGDAVEDRSSRRKTRSRIQYGLTMDLSKGGLSQGKFLPPNSKIIDAYPVHPVFKTATANKRRSTDSAMLLSMAEEQIRSDDPIFILRAVSAHAHAHGKHGKSVRALSPTEGRLVSKQEQQRQADVDSYKASNQRAESSVSLDNVSSSNPSSAPIPRSRQQEVIAAQRAAAKERKAAVLGAQRNDVHGIDLYLDNMAKIRSSRSLEGTIRYSYLPDSQHGSEVDISSIVEDVLADQDPFRGNSVGGSGISRPAGPNRDASSMTLNTFHSPPTTPTALAAPMDPKDAHIDWKSRSQASLTAPLSVAGTKGTKETDSGDRDLLETFVRNPEAEEATIEDRIDAVLSRVSRAKSGPADSQNAAQAGRSAGRRTPTAAQSTLEDGTYSGAYRIPIGAVSDAGGSSFGGRTTADTYKSGIGSELSHDGTATTTPTPVSAVGNNATAGAPLNLASRVMPMGAIFATNTANQVRGNQAVGRSVGMSSASRSVSAPPTSHGAAAYIPTDDFGLDHLYTLVDAAMRRDPNKYTQVLTRARSTTPGGKRISSMTAAAAAASSSSPLSNPLSSPHQYAMMLQLAPVREPLRPQVAGLFFAPPSSESFPSNTTVEDRAVAEHYAPLNRQMNQMEDTLDELLADVMRVF